MFAYGQDDPVATPEVREWLDGRWPVDLPPPWDDAAWDDLAAWDPHPVEDMPCTDEVRAGVPLSVLADELDRSEPVAMSEDRLIVRIRTAQRLVNAANAALLATMAELHDRRLGTAARPTHRGVAGMVEFVADEVGCALHLSRGAAAARIDLAVALNERLPATATALAAGDLDWTRTAAIHKATTPLSGDVARVVEQRVLGRAGEQTPGQLRRALARAVIAADPAGAEHRHQVARDARKVVQHHQPDGMAGLWALLPADGARTVMIGLTALADAAKVPDDRRTIDQRRADVLVDTFRNVLDQPDLPATRLGRPHIHLTIAASTLAGLDSEPGMLSGYGPVPADMARDIAANGTWRCLATDTHGALAAVANHTQTPGADTAEVHGEAGYAPSRRLARLVTLRDHTCRFPGCAQPACRCDLDHRTPWPDGPTCDCNLIALCRHHHRAKHEGGWSVRPAGSTVDPDNPAGPRDTAAGPESPGTLIWTSPTGHHYRTEPASYDHDPPPDDRAPPSEADKDEPPL